MKRIQILLCVSLLLILGVAGCVLADLPSGLPAGLAAVSAGCLGVILWLAYRQQQMMDFLVRDNRKLKTTQGRWDDGEAQKLELLRKRVDLSTLQMQINPHFLYNTLDTIRSQALMDGQQDIAAMTEKLSRFFRYCISNRENMVRLQEEMDHIQDYYYIQKRRFGDRFEMELWVEEDALYEYYIPKLTLQPLVENAISHGLEKVKRRGIITIKIFSTEQKVIIRVSDNGIGMTEEKLAELNERLRLRQIKVGPRKGRNNGIAIMNVNSRIRLTFGEAYGIHYRSVENVGTEAVVTLPKVDEFARVRYEDLLMTEE